MGDEVLIELAGVMKRVCRSNDTAARYGGEEFTLILPETKAAGATNIAERVCNELAQCRFQYDDDEFCVTISAGVVEYDERIKSPVHMIKLADKALYKAKDLGKNQTYQSVPEDDSAN
jgi:diguanylate cyclase (GGDEF)-like protein